MTKTFITDKQLSDWKEAMINSAKNNLIKNGSVMPVAMLYCANQEHRIYGTQFESNEDKNAFTNFLRQEMKKHDVLAYMFISEAWMATYDKDDKAGYKNADGSYKKPSEDPNKIECIFVTFETKISNEVICIEIKRENGKIKFGKENRNGKHEAGRFADILKMPIVKN